MCVCVGGVGWGGVLHTDTAYCRPVSSRSCPDRAHHMCCIMLAEEDCAQGSWLNSQLLGSEGLGLDFSAFRSLLKGCMGVCVCVCVCACVHVCVCVCVIF